MALTAFYLPAIPILLYAGFEDNWANLPLPLPQADGAIFSAQLSHNVQPIEKVAEWLENAGFQQLLCDARATVRDWSGHGDIAYTGHGDLLLYGARHGQHLWVLAAGEYQPALYKTYLHGGWQLS